jgi:hypothetical protein
MHYTSQSRCTAGRSVRPTNDLLRQLKPRAFAQPPSYIDTQEVRTLVTQTAASLDKLAIDREHSPALFASFLRRVLEMDVKGVSDKSSAPLTNTSTTISGTSHIIPPDNTLEGDNPLWLDGFHQQLLFNNAFYNTPSQACLGDDFWDSLLPNLSGPSIVTPAWLATNKTSDR